MAYRVELSKRAAKAIKELPVKTQKRVLSCVTALGENPRPDGVKKLKGTDYYRIRVGDYRMIYSVHDGILEVLVLRVGHRRDVYNS